MSYDRVLPKPEILYHDSSRQDHRRSRNTLLEHKIMNDKFSNVAEEGDGNRRLNSLLAERAAPPGPLQPLALRSSVNCEESMTEDPNAPHTRRRVATIATGLSNADVREESSPLSSPKPASTKESVVQFCLCQPDPKIPRPRNAFILYRQHYQASVVAQNPGLANPEISKIIGEQWRALPNETKKEWKALAEEEKARHQQQYPDYRYQPRRYGRSANIGNSTAVAINGNSTGASVCSRCGGRIMNPPSTPSTPFTPSGPVSATASPRFSHAPPRSFQARATREGARIPSPVQIPVDQKAHPRQRLREDPPSCLSPDPKRRRFSPNGSYTPIQREMSPDSQYPFPSPRRASLPRPEAIHPRSAYPMGPPPRPYRGGQAYQNHDPNLTLPPLQTVSLSPPANKSIEAMVMTIPFINKIKVLAKISPPYAPRPTAGSAGLEARGAVVAVEGQDKESVNCMLQYLKEDLQSKDGEYNVRVFEGPDPGSYSAKSEELMGDATVQYLDTISAWHKVSDEIVHFITDIPGPPTPSVSGTEEPSSATSPKSIIPKTAKLRIGGSRNSPTAIATGGSAGAATTPATPKTGTTPKSALPSTTFPLPVALVPRYQLSTADAHACANPINDAYAPVEHWQWMASLWRGCVGPDITIYVRGCEKDELNKYGGGTPVEIRLNDARSLVVRKPNDTESEIDEKALRRVGFEVEEFLRK